MAVERNFVLDFGRRLGYNLALDQDFEHGLRGLGLRVDPSLVLVLFRDRARSRTRLPGGATPPSRALEKNPNMVEFI